MSRSLITINPINIITPISVFIIITCVVLLLVTSSIDHIHYVLPDYFVLWDFSIFSFQVLSSVTNTHDDSIIDRHLTFDTDMAFILWLCIEMFELMINMHIMMWKLRPVIFVHRYLVSDIENHFTIHVEFLTNTASSSVILCSFISWILRYIIKYKCNWRILMRVIFKWGEVSL